MLKLKDLKTFNFSRVPYVMTDGERVIYKNSGCLCQDRQTDKNPHLFLLKEQKKSIEKMENGAPLVIDFSKRSLLGRAAVMRCGENFLFWFSPSLSRSCHLSCSDINKTCMPVLQRLALDRGNTAMLFEGLSERALSICDIPLESFLRVASSSLRLLCGDDVLKDSGAFDGISVSKKCFYALGELCQRLVGALRYDNSLRAEVSVSNDTLEFYLDGIEVSRAELQRMPFLSVVPYVYSDNEELGALLLALICELCAE